MELNLLQTSYAIQLKPVALPKVDETLLIYANTLQNSGAGGELTTIATTVIQP